MIVLNQHKPGIVESTPDADSQSNALGSKMEALDFEIAATTSARVSSNTRPTHSPTAFNRLHHVSPSTNLSKAPIDITQGMSLNAHLRQIHYQLFASEQQLQATLEGLQLPPSSIILAAVDGDHQAESNKWLLFGNQHGQGTIIRFNEILDCLRTFQSTVHTNDPAIDTGQTDWVERFVQDWQALEITCQQGFVQADQLVFKWQAIWQPMKSAFEFLGLDISKSVPRLMKPQDYFSETKYMIASGRLTYCVKTSEIAGAVSYTHLTLPTTPYV